MSILAYTQLTNDGRPNNDTLITAVAISDAQQVSPIYPEYVCSGDDVVLGVSIPTQGKVLWTSGLDTLAFIDADSTLTLNGLTNDTTITVGSSPYSVNVGQSSPGSGYSYSAVDCFITYSAMTLDSVTCICQTRYFKYCDRRCYDRYSTIQLCRKYYNIWI